MTKPLTVVGIDASGTVMATRTLAPGRVVLMRGAVWILELAREDPAPAVGSRIRVTRPLT